jgi:hypothetical protein
MRQVIGLCVLVAVAGCATQGEETRRSSTTPRRQEQASVGEAGDPSAISPEKFEELDMYFRKKADHLAHVCYNAEVEKTGKKFEGNLTLSMVIHGSGKKAPADGEEGDSGHAKAQAIKVTGSTLRMIGGEAGTGKGIEECVIAEVQSWEWPDVPANAPYSGSLSFKSRW